MVQTLQNRTVAVGNGYVVSFRELGTRLPEK